MAGIHAKPSKKRSLVRAARNKASGKYTKQRLRTAANKAAKRAAHLKANPNDRQETP